MPKEQAGQISEQLRFDCEASAAKLQRSTELPPTRREDAILNPYVRKCREGSDAWQNFLRQLVDNVKQQMAQPAFLQGISGRDSTWLYRD